MDNSAMTDIVNCSVLADGQQQQQSENTQSAGNVLANCSMLLVLANTSLSDSGNDTFNCTNDYCMSEEEYFDAIEQHIFPTVYEWVLISLHSLVFLVGLVGNFLVCLAVYRNHTMRTVTNMFIVNLAIADFLVIFLCLPPTVLWDVTETWFMGKTLCKIIPYFQTVSVSVSVLTLTFISVDRWYAICHPLKFRSTISRAKKAIAAIWIISLLIDIPELVFMETRPRPNLSVETIYFTDCIASWDNVGELYNILIKFALLYALPLFFITITYWQIIRVLWRSSVAVRMTSSSRHSNANAAASTAAANEDQTESGNTTGRHRGQQLNHHNNHHSSNKDMLMVNSNASIEMQLLSRRKAAKMLVVVVIVFAVCYFPVHVIAILRSVVTPERLPQNDYTVAAAMISHWLCYFNSAINPVIYNFMSGKFRKEFRRTFRCRCRWLDRYFPSLGLGGGDTVREAHQNTVATGRTAVARRGGTSMWEAGGRGSAAALNRRTRNLAATNPTVEGAAAAVEGGEAITVFGGTVPNGTGSMVAPEAERPRPINNYQPSARAAAIYPLRHCRSNPRPSSSSRSAASRMLHTTASLQFISTSVP